ncbi:MAG: hypothetical protein ACYDGM_04460 [Vulcanimicrobiaceae bacterium]
MRTNAYFQLILLLVATGCAAHRSADAAATPLPSPAPLQSCETRELTLDGATVVLHANIDATLGTAVVVRAPSGEARAAALADVQRMFGAIDPDTRTVTTLNKWGVPFVSDPCGRPIAPSGAPSASPGPSASP